MNKLITFFLVLFIGSAILTGVMEGGGGISITQLTSSVDEDDIVLLVTSTSNFLDTDYIELNDEIILYTGKTNTTFTGLTRGYQGTIPQTHLTGTNIYTTQASAINHALGFNVAATADSMGWWSAITVPFYFFSKTLPQLVAWNVSFFSGDLAILGFFFFAAGIGLIVTLGLALIGTRRVSV